MYWLSRQRLPRKAGMAASLGTAVHASIEDLLNMDLEGRDGGETGWLPLTAEGFLRTRWDEEKEVFMATQFKDFTKTLVVISRGGGGKKAQGKMAHDFPR